MTGDLRVVGVEGLPEGEEVEGEEVIDVAEYFGGHDAESCARYSYTQLKHSTLRTDQRIVASDLDKTLKKFAKIYRGELTRGREGKLEFVVIANRILSGGLRLSLQELAAGATVFSRPSVVRLLRRYMAFGADVEHEARFCQRLRVNDGAPALVDIEQLLRDELQQFLPGGGTGTEMAQLMEKISRCATSLADKQTLEAADILLALRTNEEELFPAQSAIEQLGHVIHTKDIDDVAAQLRNGVNSKILVTAVGGVGKSILASFLERVLPEGSVTIVYDCFAGGGYRKISSQRHEHRVALTQISNQLAAKGLCTPLIPAQAPDSSYMRTFMRRVSGASEAIARENADALLTIVIDAADNAALAAQEQRGHTFVTDLFREDWPPNARLLQMCRPERKQLLGAPNTGITWMRLAGFQKAESLEHLRTSFPEATEEEGAELHVLSGGNPRVQAMAMESAGSVTDALAALQIARDRPGEMLDTLLAQQVHAVADQGHLRPDELSRLCEALATLHPPMPLKDLADITRVNADGIRSFAVALGRGLHAAGNTLQFRDEPTETWFRTNHSLDPARMREFATAVEPLAVRSPYIASMFPQLLFEAGMLDKLVELALSDAGLPGAADELQAQEISRARARFALCATLRERRNAQAALLAVKTGDLSSGHSRKMKLFRTHADLTARFVGPDIVDNLCSSRELAYGWPGSNLHVEAELLSHIDQFKDMARSRLRSARNNIAAIFRLPETERRHLIRYSTVDVVAGLAMAAINVDGPQGAIEFLAGCRPEGFARQVASKLCARIADAGRKDDLADLIVQGDNHEHVQAAVAEITFEYNSTPPDAAVRVLTAMLTRRREPFERVGEPSAHEPDVRGIVWALVHGLRANLVTDAEALRILAIHLPSHLPDSAGSRWYTGSPTSVLLGYALRARLTGATLRVEDVAGEEMLKLMGKKNYSNERGARDFAANIPGLLPWTECWLAAMLDGDTEQVTARFEALVSSDLKPVSDYQTPFVFINLVAEMAARILAIIPRQDLAERFVSWHRAADRSLARSRLTVARIAARSSDLQEFALDVVTRGAAVAQNDRTDAESRVESLIDLARPLLSVNLPEAQALFDAASKEAELVGDDLYVRWQSLMDTAEVLAYGTEPARAYRLFQIGEELSRVNDGIDVIELGDRLGALHDPTYLAAASRARDRRTLNFDHMLVRAVEGSTGSHPAGLGNLALHALAPRSSWRTGVSRHRPAEAAMAAEVFEAYSRCERASEDVPPEWTSSTISLNDRQPDAPLDPAARFAASDFTAEDAWNDALSHLTWRSEERQVLAEFAIDKHPTRRPEVLDALGRAAKATEADFANLAQAAAVRRPQTLALKRALERLGTTFATRFARHIGIVAYEDSTIAAVAEATGATVGGITQTALQELGRSAHQLTYREYFHLASHLAKTLDTAAAGVVFDALASLFEDLAPSATTSDGAYETLTIPPADSASCVAGVIWAALGDIAIESRWRAAHAVLLLTQLGCKHELDALARFAAGTESMTPFIDSRFPFYALHSRMWLLLALARAAQEPNAATLANFTIWLAGIIRGPHHAVNQVLAQRTLIKLQEGNFVAPDGPDGVLAVRVVANWVSMDYAEQRARPNPATQEEDGDDETADFERPWFFLDFEPYWCDKVAEIFGSTEKDIARRAAEVVTTLDGYDIFAAQKDPRADAGVYDQEHSHPDHDSWPGQDNLSFYMAVHALLTVAAALAETVPAYKDPDSAEDSYTSWMARFLPKRPDGRWLADRRDPAPTPAPESVLANQDQKTNWPWTISKDDFENVVSLRGDWIAVATDIQTSHGDLSEERAVASTLVPNSTARSLLVTLQSSPLGPYSQRMPTTDDDHDRPDKDPFELIPWLDATQLHYGIDERDEHGGGISFPPVGPGKDIITRFELTTDEDRRLWFHKRTPVFRSTIWSNMSQVTRDRETGTRGGQLEVSRQFLNKVLQQLDMTLVLRVVIRRDTHRPYYKRRKESNEFDWLEWSGKFYLIDPAGHWLEY